MRSLNGGNPPPDVDRGKFETDYTNLNIGKNINIDTQGYGRLLGSQ